MAEVVLLDENNKELPPMHFAETFWTPYDEQRGHIGKQFEVLGEVDRTSFDFDECGQTWNIRFEDGIEIQVLPEEIVQEVVDDVKRQIGLRGTSLCS